MEQPRIYTLSKILGGIKGHIDSRMENKCFWLRTEISKSNRHATGHWYLDIHETEGTKPIAKCTAKLWKGTASKLKQRLKGDFENILNSGNEVLCYVKVEFHVMYGLSFIIEDIDLNFAVGNVEKNKQAVIERLTQEGLTDRNKRHPLPAVIQRIAVVGSPGTDGITDLIKHLKTNQYGYHYDIQVFACSVQGANAEREILARLEELEEGGFDLVALVRGGGSKLDMDVFNSYGIAERIANHSLPVFTGIGHEQDVCVADLVASLNHKTPTALGAFLVEQASDFEDGILFKINAVQEVCKALLKDRRNVLSAHAETLKNKGVYQAQLKRGKLNQSLSHFNADVLKRLNADRSSLQGTMQQIREKARLEVAGHESRLNAIKTNLENVPLNILNTERIGLNDDLDSLHDQAQSIIQQGIRIYRDMLREIAEHASQKVERDLRYKDSIVRQLLPAYHPGNLLSKGYAIPRYKGRLLNGSLLKAGEEVEIELEGRVLLVSYISETPKTTLQIWMRTEQRTSLTKPLLKN